MRIRNCDLDTFRERIENKQLICFGSGRAIEKFCEQVRSYDIENHISYIVDNDARKWGSQKQLTRVSREIVSIDEMISKLSKETMLLITCFDLGTVYEQLSNIIELEDVECYFYGFLLDTQYCEMIKNVKLPDSFRLSEEMKIPKVIHYCWFGGNPIPDKYKKWMESWQKYCPDYEIKEWNETNYDVTKNQYMKMAYDAKMWAFVSDYARLDIVYNHGGIYLDTDVEVIRNLDELLYQDGFCGFQDNSYVASGLGIGARKGLTIIKALRDAYNQEVFVKSEKMKPCIAYETDVLSRCGLKRNGQLQFVKSLSVYPSLVLRGKSLYLGENVITEKTFTIHHFAASWVDSVRAEQIKSLKRIWQLAKKDKKV